MLLPIIGEKVDFTWDVPFSALGVNAGTACHVQALIILVDIQSLNRTYHMRMLACFTN